LCEDFRALLCCAGLLFEFDFVHRILNIGFRFANFSACRSAALAADDQNAEDIAARQSSP
jgi:hypothetical protein